MRISVLMVASVALAGVAVAVLPDRAAAQKASPAQPALAQPAPAQGGAAQGGVQSSAELGQKIAFDRAKGNCLACHTMKGSDVPSDVGPKLDDMKERFPDRKRLYDVIYDEMKNNPQTVMPIFGKNQILSPAEINHVIDFLYTL